MSESDLVWDLVALAARAEAAEKELEDFRRRTMEVHYELALRDEMKTDDDYLRYIERVAGAEIGQGIVAHTSGNEHTATGSGAKVTERHREGVLFRRYTVKVILDTGD